MKNKSRMLILYTPSYASNPFKIVYDSSVHKQSLEKAEAKWDKQHEKDEDAELQIVRAGLNITNDEVLKYFNNTMGIATKRSMTHVDESLKANRILRQIKELVK